jgi:hypothetical protein
LGSAEGTALLTPPAPVACTALVVNGCYLHEAAQIGREVQNASVAV